MRLQVEQVLFDVPYTRCASGVFRDGTLLSSQHPAPAFIAHTQAVIDNASSASSRSSSHGDAWEEGWWEGGGFEGPLGRGGRGEVEEIGGVVCASETEIERVVHYARGSEDGKRRAGGGWGGAAHERERACGSSCRDALPRERLGESERVRARGGMTDEKADSGHEKAKSVLLRGNGGGGGDEGGGENMFSSTRVFWAKRSGPHTPTHHTHTHTYHSHAASPAVPLSVAHLSETFGGGGVTRRSNEAYPYSIEHYRQQLQRRDKYKTPTATARSDPLALHPSWGWREEGGGQNSFDGRQKSRGRDTATVVDWGMGVVNIAGGGANTTVHYSRPPARGGG